MAHQPIFFVGETVLGPDGEGEILSYDHEDVSYEVMWDSEDTQFVTWVSEEDLLRWREEYDYDYESDVDEAQEWADFDPDC